MQGRTFAFIVAALIAFAEAEDEKRLVRQIGTIESGEKTIGSDQVRSKRQVHKLNCECTDRLAGFAGEPFSNGNWPTRPFGPNPYAPGQPSTPSYSPPGGRYPSGTGLSSGSKNYPAWPSSSSNGGRPGPSFGSDPYAPGQPSTPSYSPPGGRYPSGPGLSSGSNNYPAWSSSSPNGGRQGQVYGRDTYSPPGGRYPSGSGLSSGSNNYPAGPSSSSFQSPCQQSLGSSGSGSSYGPYGNNNPSNFGTGPSGWASPSSGNGLYESGRDTNNVRPTSPYDVNRPWADQYPTSSQSGWSSGGGSSPPYSGNDRQGYSSPSVSARDNQQIPGLNLRSGGASGGGSGAGRPCGQSQRSANLNSRSANSNGRCAHSSSGGADRGRRSSENGSRSRSAVKESVAEGPAEIDMKHRDKKDVKDEIHH